MAVAVVAISIALWMMTMMLVYISHSQNEDLIFNLRADLHRLQREVDRLKRDRGDNAD